MLQLTSRTDRSRADPSPSLRTEGSGEACREGRRASELRRLDRREPGPCAASPSEAAGVACLGVERRRVVFCCWLLRSVCRHAQRSTVTEIQHTLVLQMLTHQVPVRLS